LSKQSHLLGGFNLCHFTPVVDNKRQTLEVAEESVALGFWHGAGGCAEEGVGREEGKEDTDQVKKKGGTHEEFSHSKITDFEIPVPPRISTPYLSGGHPCNHACHFLVLLSQAVFSSPPVPRHKILSIDYLDVVAIMPHSYMFNKDTKVHSISFNLKVDRQPEEDWLYRFNDGWGNFNILSVRTGDTYAYSIKLNEINKNKYSVFKSCSTRIRDGQWLAFNTVKILPYTDQHQYCECT